MRWTSWMVSGVVGAALLATPAWADDERAPKKDRPKGERGEGVRQEVAGVIRGVDTEQIEKALALLKEHHPKVEAKAREGELKLWSADGKAFEAALADLGKLGVPIADLTVLRPGKPKQDDPKAIPADAEFEHRLAALEQKLATAREAGEERKVAALERQLAEARATRKMAALRRAQASGEVNVKELRARLEEVQRELEGARRGAQAANQDVKANEEQMRVLRRHLEELSRPEGDPKSRPGAGAERRGERGPGPMPPMHERMRHTREAIEHLQAAGLEEQVQRARQALERMERATEDQREGPGPDLRRGAGSEGPRGPQGPGPRGMGPRGMGPRSMGPEGVGPRGMGPFGPWQQGPGPQDSAARGLGQPGAGPREARRLHVRALPPGLPPGPPLPAAQGAPHMGHGAELHTLPEGPPPSVGGVRRGTIHHRPHVQRRGPPAPPPPPFEHRRHGGPASVTTFGAGRGPQDGPAWTTRRDSTVHELEVEEVEVLRSEERTELGGATTFVFEGPDGEHGSRTIRVVKRGEGPAARREHAVPGAVGSPKVLVLEGKEPELGSQAQIERLRAEMDDLKQQLHELLRALDRR